MPDKEKIDMLMEQLAMLYEIEADLETESDVLTYKINITEVGTSFLK